MSSTFSFKVHEKIRRKMKGLSSEIDWPRELREYVSRRITDVERERLVEKADELLQIVKPSRKGTSSGLVREDRESH